MSATTKSPFSTWPATQQTTDKDGKPLFIVSPRILTPLRAKIADIAAMGSAALLMVKGIELLTTLAEVGPWQFGAALFGPWLALPLISHLYRRLLLTTVQIRITPDRFSVRRSGGWEHYDRQLDHAIRPVPHDKARDEREQHELAQRRAQLKSKVISPTRYYGESWHISFQYLDQRNDILTVFGRKEANAIVARLKACDGVMNNVAGGGDGTPLTPEAEWGEQPGEIPEGS